MTSLLLTTMAMMGLTFMIGFIVAGVIKIIAVWADSYECYGSRSEEIIRFKKLRKLRLKIAETLGLVTADSTEPYDEELENFYRGENEDLAKVKPKGYYHGVSHGVSDMDLMGYYYPKDTRMMFLFEKQEQMMKKQKKSEKDSPSKK